MLLRLTTSKYKSYLCVMCRIMIVPNCSYSQELESEYSDEQKVKILKVMNCADVGTLTRYDITKARAKYVKQWKNNNGLLKSLSDIDNVEGFPDKFAKKLFDSILEGPNEEVTVHKVNNRIKGQILHPPLSETVRQNCKTVLTVYISVNSVCWTLIDKSTYEVVEWKYYGIDSPEGKRFQITDIMNIAWRVTRSLPSADIYVMKAEATTLRAAGSDPNNPKVLAVNLQKAQLVAMVVALVNARSNRLSDTDEHGKVNETEEIIKYKVYFLRPTLPYRLFGTLVGNEKVSTDQTVEMLLQEMSEKSSDNSQAYVPEALRTSFRSQNELQKDMLGHSLLLALTFMDLCIYKRKESIEKLVKRGN